METTMADNMKEIEKFYKIGESFFFVKYASASHHTDFSAWIAVPVDNKPTFGEDRDPSPDSVPPLIQGSVKWDGCSNFNFPEADEGLIHGCKRADLVAIGTILGRIYDQAIRLCPRSDSGILGEAQDIVEDSGFPWETWKS